MTFLMSYECDRCHKRSEPLPDSTSVESWRRIESQSLAGYNRDLRQSMLCADCAEILQRALEA